MLSPRNAREYGYDAFAENVYGASIDIAKVRKSLATGLARPGDDDKAMTCIFIKFILRCKTTPQSRAAVYAKMQMTVRKTQNTYIYIYVCVCMCICIKVVKGEISFECEKASCLPSVASS